MAGQFLTMGEIKQAVVFRGDLEGITDRHPDINLTQEINLSAKHLRQKLAIQGVKAALTNTVLANLPTTAPASFPEAWFCEIDWPVDAVSVHGLDVLVGGSWGTVTQGDLAQRTHLQYGNSNRGDYAFPEAIGARWFERSLPSTSTSGVGKIMLAPIPTSGRYTLWYLQPWVDLTSDSSELQGQELWTQWIIWDVTAKCLIRDTGPQASEQLNRAELARAQLWSDIVPTAQRVAGDGPIEMLSRYGSRRGGRGARLIP